MNSHFDLMPNIWQHWDWSAIQQPNNEFTLVWKQDTVNTLHMILMYFSVKMCYFIFKNSTWAKKKKKKFLYLTKIFRYIHSKNWMKGAFSE